MLQDPDGPHSSSMLLHTRTDSRLCTPAQVQYHVLCTPNSVLTCTPLPTLLSWEPPLLTSPHQTRPPPQHHHHPLPHSWLQNSALLPAKASPRLQLPGDLVHLKGRKKEKGRKNRKKEGNQRMKPDRRGSGALSYLSASQWIWTLLSSVLPVSVSQGNTAPIWQACSRLGWAPGPHWRPGAWLAVEPPPHLPLLLTLDTACVYLKQGGGAIWKVFVRLWEKGRGGWRQGGEREAEGGRRVSGGGVERG